MTSDFTGGGDLRRTIETLWGAAGPGRRGPKPRKSVDEVVMAAVDLADREGLAAVSMRRVAEAVGLSPMSLYTYVPSKTELVDLMLHRVWGEMRHIPPDFDGWRGRLEFIAREQWALGMRHPWMLQIAANRPPMGPNLLASLESWFRALEGLGLTGVEMDMLLNLISDYVRGALRTVMEAEEVEQRTGITDEQWWQMNETLLVGVVNGADYPVLMRVGAELKAHHKGRTDRTGDFEFGLQRILDGVGAYIAAKAQSAASADR